MYTPLMYISSPGRHPKSWSLFRSTQSDWSDRVAHRTAWRGVFCRSEAGSQRLLLVCHHLVVDLVSWQVMVEDLEKLGTWRNRG